MQLNPKMTHCFCSEWRMQLQHLIAADFAVDSAVADVAAEVAVEDADVDAAVDAERKRRTGSPSPNWAVLSRTEKSSLSRKFTFSLFPSK